MTNILNALAQSQALQVLGLACLVTVLLVPIILRLAGLKPPQIVEIIRLTLQFFLELSRAFRDENKSGKAK